MIAWAVREVLFGLGDVKKLFERFVCGERCELTDMLSDFFFSFFFCDVQMRCQQTTTIMLCMFLGGYHFSQDLIYGLYLFF